MNKKGFFRPIFATSIVAAAALFGAVPSAHADPRFLALGDSYTAGTGVDASKAWPAQLVHLFARNQIAVAPPVVIAREGWTAAELTDAIDASNVEGPFDLVTILIGVNDQFRGGTAESFRPKFREVFKRALKFSGNNPTRIVVISIPDYGATPFGQERNPKRISADIDAFNAVLREESRSLGARYVDITTMSRFASRNAQLTGSDGLHPSEKFHAVWARVIYPAAHGALNSTLR